MLIGVLGHILMAYKVDVEILKSIYWQSGDVERGKNVMVILGIYNYVISTRFFWSTFSLG